MTWLWNDTFSHEV